MNDARSGLRLGLMLGVLFAPGPLGSSAVTVALPALASDLGLTPAQAAWALVGYLLAWATAVGVFGRLADVTGLRAVLLASGALIAVGSEAAAASPGLSVLVAGRVLQGAGVGGAMVAAFGLPAELAGEDTRVRVLAIMTAVVSVVSGSGSLTGGLLTDAVSWRAVVALPALALPALGPVARLARGPAAAPGQLDLVGAALVATLAAAVVLLLQTPTLDPVPGVVAAEAAMLVAAAAGLVARVRTVPRGFVPAAVIGSRAYAVGMVLALALGAGYFAALFAAPQLLLDQRPRSATEIGLVLLPGAFVAAVASRFLTPRLSRLKTIPVAGCLAVVSAAGLALGGIGDGSPVATVAALSLAMAAYVAGQVVLVASVPLAVDVDVRGLATGLLMLVFMVGGAVGPAAVTGLAGPLGLPPAVSAVAVVPLAGAAAALAGRKM